jgi:hypothetical protein
MRNPWKRYRPQNDQRKGGVPVVEVTRPFHPEEGESQATQAGMAQFHANAPWHNNEVAVYGSPIEPEASGRRAVHK